MTSSPVDEPPFTPPGRGIYANRTLNVRSLRAVGFDMDYTLIHYRVDEWERAAFTHALEWLAGQGWPVDDLQFDPDAYTLGLTFDLDLGNLVKATRFGHVVKAQHGTRALGFDEQRTAYAETVIDLAEERFEFMNTLFELSRAALWCQLIDVHDAGRLPGVVSYADLWRQIDRALSSAHQGGRLKAEIVNEPDRFVVPDPELVAHHADGWYVTLRLRSTFYHRFHAPVAGRVREVQYVSGDTWNVNPIALRRVERLFCKNERAVIPIEPARPGVRLTLVPVAAICVASLRLHFLARTLDLRHRGPNRFVCDVSVAKGDELGYFQHGSTILVFARGNVEFAPQIREGQLVRVGQPLFRRRR